MAFPGAAVVGATALSNLTTITMPGPASAGNYQLMVLTSAGGGDVLTTPSGWTLRGDVTITSPGSAPDRGGTQHVWVLSQDTPSTASVVVTKSTSRRWAGARFSWSSVQAVTYLSGTPTAAATSSATGSTTHTTSGLTPPANTDATVVGICAIDIGPDNTATTITPPASPWATLLNYKSAAATEGQLIAVAAREVAGTGSPAAVTAAFTTSEAEEAGLMPVLLHGTASTGVPTVGAGTDAAVVLGDLFTRTATESDNGSAITSRAWTILSGPAGVGSTIGTAAALSWTPTVVGSYVLRYVATNAVGASTPDDVTVTVSATAGAPPAFGSVGAVLAGLASQTTAVVPAPAGLAADDIVLVSLYKENGAAVTAPAGFTAVATPPSTPTVEPQWHYLFWKRATASEPASYSFTWTGSTYRAAVAHRYTGCVTSGSPVDVVNTAARDSDATVTPAVAVTTTGDNRLLVWAASSFDNVPWTAPTGYTLRAPTSGTFVLAVATKPQTAAGASGSVTGTQTVSSNSQTAWLLALLPAAAAAPTAPTVDAGADVASHVVSTAFTRTASESSNGSAITARQWRITAGPGGVTVPSVIGTAAALSWTPSVLGAYTLEYTATNAIGTSAPDTMAITVVAAAAIPDVVVRQTREVFTSTGSAGNSFPGGLFGTALCLAVASVNKNAGTFTPPASFTARATYANTSVSGQVASAQGVNGGTYAWSGANPATLGVTVLLETNVTGWAYRAAATAPSPAADTDIATLTANPGAAPAAGVVFAVLGVDSSWDDGGAFGAAGPTWPSGWTPVGVFQDAVLATSPYGGAACAVAFKPVAAGDPTTCTVTWGTADQAYLHAVLFDVTATGSTDTPGTLTSSWIGVDAVSLVVAGGSGPVRVDVSTDSGMASPVSSVDVTPDGLGNARVPLPGGLTPGGTYYYRAYRGGAYIGSAVQFKVPGIPLHFGFASCRSQSANEPSPNPVALASAKARGAQLWLWTGDISYPDISTNTPSAFRSTYDELFTRSNIAAILNGVPSAYVWSDHDYGGDASHGGTASKPAAQSVYRERVPHTTLPSPTGGIYHTFVIGPCRFIMLDTRSYRSVWTATDDSSKAMLGTEQKAWLQNLLATAEEPLTFVVSDVPWIGGAGEDDHWGAYQTERAVVAGWIAAATTEVVMLCGDAHMLAIDNGTNSPGGCHVWHAAALNRFTSVKGGPYSGGTNAGQNQYGYVVVTETATQVQATFTGYLSNNTVWNTDTVTVPLGTDAPAASAPLPVTGLAPQVATDTPAAAAAVTLAAAPAVVELLTVADAAALVAAGQAASAELATPAAAAALAAAGHDPTGLVEAAAPAGAATPAVGALGPTVEADTEAAPDTAAAAVTVPEAAQGVQLGADPAAVVLGAQDGAVLREGRATPTAADAVATAYTPERWVQPSAPAAAVTVEGVATAPLVDVAAQAADLQISAPEAASITSGEVLPDPATAAVTAPQVTPLPEALPAPTTAAAGISAGQAVTEVGATAGQAPAAVGAQPVVSELTTPAASAAVASEVLPTSAEVTTPLPATGLTLTGAQPDAGGSKLIDTDPAAADLAAHPGAVELGMATGAGGGPFTALAPALDQQVLVPAPAADLAVLGRAPSVSGAAAPDAEPAGGPFAGAAPSPAVDVPAADAAAEVAARQAGVTAADVYQVHPDVAAATTAGWQPGNTSVAPGPLAAEPNPQALPASAAPSPTVGAAAPTVTGQAARPEVAPTPATAATAVTGQAGAPDTANRALADAAPAAVPLPGQRPTPEVAPTPLTGQPAVAAQHGGPSVGAPADLVAAAVTGADPEHTQSTTPAAAPVGTSVTRPGLEVTGTIDVPAEPAAGQVTAHPPALRISGRATPPAAEVGTAGLPPGAEHSGTADTATAVVRPQRPGAEVTPQPPGPANLEVPGEDAAGLRESRPHPAAAQVAVTGPPPSFGVTSQVVPGAEPTVAALHPLVAVAVEAAAQTAAMVAAAAGPGVRADVGVVTALCMLAACDALAVVPALHGTVGEYHPARPTVTAVASSGPSIVAEYQQTARPTITASQSPGPSIVGDTVRAAMHQVSEWRRGAGTDE